MDGDISVRVTGRACFDVTDDIARRIYEGNEVLRRLYPGYKAMVYFRLPVTAVDYYDLAPTPPVLEHWFRLPVTAVDYYDLAPTPPVLEHWER